MSSLTRTTRRLSRTVTELVCDDRGQDLIEYVLLTAFIGLAGAVAWINIRDSIGATYTSYDTGVQGIWEQPAPTGGGS